MKIQIGTAHSLGMETMVDLARYRYAVFVQHLEWRLQTQCGLEFDQFDRPDTRHVLARAADGRIVGVARLLPTTRPYLLGEVFPQLMDGAPLPCAEGIWELSRFAALDLAAGAASQCFDSATMLLQAVLDDAARHGVRRLITVSPLGIERLLDRCGFKASRAGEPRLVDGQQLFACWIDVPMSAQADSRGLDAVADGLA
jgi:acyl homoserine lactone synthase